MNAPRTYAEWVKILKTLESRTDDDSVLRAMQSGTLEWQSGVAERFVKKLDEAVTYRMNAALDRFSRDQQHAGGREQVVVQALTDLRKELTFLYRCMDIPALPEDIRKKCTDGVQKNADQIQQNLEYSAANGSDRTGKLSWLIQNNRVNDLRDAGRK